MPGVMPDDWRPSDRDIDFASMSGMNNKEIELQVPLFVRYNQEIRKAGKSWSLNWRRWVTAWKRKQIEDAVEPPRGDRIARSLKRLCWPVIGHAGSAMTAPGHRRAILPGSCGRGARCSVDASAARPSGSNMSIELAGVGSAASPPSRRGWRHDDRDRLGRS